MLAQDLKVWVEHDPEEEDVGVFSLFVSFCKASNVSISP